MTVPNVLQRHLGLPELNSSSLGFLRKVQSFRFHCRKPGKAVFQLSLSFACGLVKLAVGRKRVIASAHIVGEVHFEGERISFSLKYKQKTKNDELE